MNTTIKNVLEPLGIPVSFQKYSGTSDTYITFFCYDERGEAWADNIETQTGFYVQVDVWSKTDYTDLVNSVVIAMTNAGFRRGYAADFYE